jgi:hypothetical protein
MAGQNRFFRRLAHLNIIQMLTRQDVLNLLEAGHYTQRIPAAAGLAITSR